MDKMRFLQVLSIKMGVFMDKIEFFPIDAGSRGGGSKGQRGSRCGEDEGGGSEGGGNGRDGDGRDGDGSRTGTS